MIRWEGGKHEKIKKGKKHILIELDSKYLNSFFYVLKRTHCTKKQKIKRKRQQFPRLTSIQQYPFDSSKQQIVKWTRIPLPLPEKHQNMEFYQL